jgi:hypothetical protein
MRLSESIDEKNKSLYDELIDAGIQIDFEIHPGEPYWKVQSRPKYVIAANSTTPNSEMLAHELLHIKMYRTGFIDTETIVAIFDPYNNFFDPKAFDQIQNLVEHMRMLPLFVDMGYEAEGFVSNYGADFFTKELIPLLAHTKGMFAFQKVLGEKPSIDHITDFLLLIISLKDIEIQNKYVAKPIDISFLKAELESIDKELFENLNCELTRWVDSGSHNNYALYTMLNYKLHTLGYSPAANSTL